MAAARAMRRLIMTQHRPTLTADYQRDWPSYFDSVRGQPPRNTCLLALDAFDREAPREGEHRVAIDLACGEGRDTRAMLERARCRWSVHSTDSSEEGLRRLAQSLSDDDAPRVSSHLLAMEDAAGSPSLPARADLVNASFALPFCRPEAFPSLWAWIRKVLTPGGRFSGQFFGVRDEWYPIRPASHITREALLGLLGGMRIEHLEEVEKEGSDAMGGVKHHHVFHVVARSPA